MNPQVRTLSGTVPGTSRNTDVENQEPNEDRSQNNTRPEVISSVYRSHDSLGSDSDEDPHSNTVETVLLWIKLRGK